MAELINLQGADRHVQLCEGEIKNLKRIVENSTQGVWSDAQRSELTSVLNAIVAVNNALREVMHNNRDGRGTPPARAKLNSMMDRIR